MENTAPLPFRQREGPKPEAWEGEGLTSASSNPHPPTASRRAPPSPPRGEGLC